MDVFQNETEVSYEVMNFVKGVGRLFYVVNPKENVFKTVEEVPNFYVQSWPYFFMFMVLEHIILKLEGKRGIRLNDGITSLSNGLFLEGARLIWRGAESYMYAWVYTHWRLMNLEWDSTATWFLAALGIDFCYYWMHRACHEVHILWAQHQVHHTSEDFNMGVGIRQSMLQGWCGFIFYLPLALAIPPAQFVMHHQFSYLYMFWIHTQAVNTLGPLEYVLNTPSHHRVHHGSNPCCIDVNYGGVLIIWDKLFGTFKAEKDTKGIVYGLIFNEPSFNPLHLQTFYTKKVINKMLSYDTWWHKVNALFNRSSWQPGQYVKFKDLKEDPTVHYRVKYDVVLPKWCTAYVLTHYSLVLFGFYKLFLVHLGLSPLTVLLFVSFIIGSLTVFGMIMDNSPLAPVFEVFRCALVLALAQWSAAMYGVSVAPPLQLFFLVSGLFWALCATNTVQITAEKKGV